MKLMAPLSVFVSSALLVPIGSYADYTDAEIIALELSGELLAPPELIAQVDADLTAIRTEYSYFESIHVYPSWIPGELLVGLTPEAFEDFLAGQYHGLDSLNQVYGPVDVCGVYESIQFIHLCFSQNYHPELLADIYEHADGVRYAQPDYTFGDGNDIFSSVLGTYTFKAGWGDCPAGCIFNHFWIFVVIEGEVHLVDDWGDPVPGVTAVDPSPASHLTYSLSRSFPNPFVRQTTIQYSLKAAGRTEVAVFDQAGRRVRTLVRQRREAGDHHVSWDGRDDRGTRVASGVYFYSLRVDGGRWTSRRATVLN